MSDLSAGILVVDDEESNLKVLERMLQKPGYRVLLPSSGPDALDIHTQNNTCYILDI